MSNSIAQGTIIQLQGKSRLTTESDEGITVALKVYQQKISDLMNIRGEYIITASLGRKARRELMQQTARSVNFPRKERGNRFKEMLIRKIIKGIVCRSLVVDSYLSQIEKLKLFYIIRECKDKVVRTKGPKIVKTQISQYQMKDAGVGDQLSFTQVRIKSLV